MSKTQEKNCRSGCPKCGSGNIAFGEVYFDGESDVFPISCPDCGTQGKEVYSMSDVDSTYKEEQS